MQDRRRPRLLLLLFSLLAFAGPARAQSEGDTAEPDGKRLIVEPATLELTAGDKTQLKARVEDADGNVLEEEVMFFSRARKSVAVDSDGNVEAIKAGEFTIVVRTRRSRGPDDNREGRVKMGKRLSTKIPVTVKRLPVGSIEIAAPEVLYADTIVHLPATALDTRGEPDAMIEVGLTSSAPDVASFDPFGRLHVHVPGAFTVTANAKGISTELALEARDNPVRSLAITAETGRARTGDVIHFSVVPQDGAGTSLLDVPVDVAVSGHPDDDLAPPASGQVAPGHRGSGDWRFVAETPGLYDIVATCGHHVARTTVRIDEREYNASLELVGRGSVNDVHTSDLWVWEGTDGRDYAVTGTWGGNGEAIFWDVTDPADLKRIATITVDARTVNDVKVDATGRLCIISREGASDRKNGIVMIDVTNPKEPKIVGTYDEGLTGGVHNLFIDGNLVYALSNGRRYDIIDVSDPSAAKTIGTYELDTPSHSIHDVWVVDGLAYSSNWSDGVHIVDVGNGIKGGTPENPVYVGSYAYPSGWNHAAFPYKNEETGRFYVVAGDEAFPYGLNLEGTPTYPRGWLHFIDFTDPDNPEEVARYQVPEAGTHNLWIEDDIVYVGYYNGGVRVVDVSGELMGDLYRQGREVDFFLPDDPDGFIKNAPMVWGPQPHKGKIFFSDWNSGLWCVELVKESKE